MFEYLLLVSHCALDTFTYVLLQPCKEMESWQVGINSPRPLSLFMNVVKWNQNLGSLSPCPIRYLWALSSFGSWKNRIILFWISHIFVIMPSIAEGQSSQLNACQTLYSPAPWNSLIIFLLHYTMNSLKAGPYLFLLINVFLVSGM